MSHYLIAGVAVLSVLLVLMGYVMIRMIRGMYRITMKGIRGFAKSTAALLVVVVFLMLFLADAVCALGLALSR